MRIFRSLALLVLVVLATRSEAAPSWRFTDASVYPGMERDAVAAAHPHFDAQEDGSLWVWCGQNLNNVRFQLERVSEVVGGVAEWNDREMVYVGMRLAAVVDLLGRPEHLTHFSPGPKLRTVSVDYLRAHQRLRLIFSRPPQTLDEHGRKF